MNTPAVRRSFVMIVAGICFGALGAASIRGANTCVKDCVAAVVHAPDPPADCTGSAEGEVTPGTCSGPMDAQACHDKITETFQVWFYRFTDFGDGDGCVAVKWAAHSPPQTGVTSTNCKDS